MQRWCRGIISNDKGAKEFADRFEEQGFEQEHAAKMYKWARQIISNDAGALELVLEFNSKDIPDDYVMKQYKWARQIISNNAGALDVVRQTYCHRFGPMPLWYTADMYKFARQKVGNNDAALALVLEWYGLVEADGDCHLIWWQLPSMAELTKDIPKFYDVIRQHITNNEGALEAVKRVIKCGGRCDVKEFEAMYRAHRQKIHNDAEAMEATLAELEERDMIST